MHEDDISLLEIYTPEKIIEDFSKKEESTKDLLDLINSTSPNPIKLKKLSIIFTSLSNCDHFSFIELTKSKNRNLRLISTFLIFSKMCDLVKENSNFELVSSLYKEVFLVRYRDVDPNIRGLCLDFIVDWIIISPKVFCTNTYLKYLGMYLNDKSDLVRKKSILGIIKLISNVKNVKENVKDLLDKNIKRILEMSINDKNINIREESSKLIIISFNKNLIEKEKVYPVLKKGIKNNKIMNEAIWGVIKSDKGGSEVESSKGYKEGDGEEPTNKPTKKNKSTKKFNKNSTLNDSLIPYFDNLHDLFLNTSHLPFNYLIFDRQDIDSLVQYTIQSYEESEFCCDKPTNCYLEILSVFKLEKVSQALSLFKTFKNSLENVRIIFKSVLDLPLESFKNEVKETINLLDDFFEFVYFNKEKVYIKEDGNKDKDGSRVDGSKDIKVDGRLDSSMVDHGSNNNNVHNDIKVNNPPFSNPHLIFNILDTFFLILKKLQNDFESKVDFYLERSQSEIPLRFFGIRSFDLSKSITKEDYSETKIFACLWFILNKEFEKVEGITLEKHLEIREILELLFFIKSKILKEEGERGNGINGNFNNNDNGNYLNGNYDDNINDNINIVTPSLCLDQNSSLFRIYFLIKKYLKVNCKDLLNPSFTPYFFRFIEENVLNDLFYLSFLFMDLEDFKKGFIKIKNKEKVIEEYFKMLMVIGNEVENGVKGDSKVNGGKGDSKDKLDYKDKLDDTVHLNSSLIYDLEDFTLKGISEVGESLNYGEKDKEGRGLGSITNLYTPINPNTPITPYFTPTYIDHIYSFSLILKSKFLKSNLVFRNLKIFIEKNLENLYDTVCVHFVSHLNSNECIILDSKLKTKCKFKTLLGKKCKDPKMGSTTYL